MEKEEEEGKDSSLFCKATRAPIQFARHVELSLSLSNALTGKAVTSHTVIWSQSALKLFIGPILHTFATSSIHITRHLIELTEITSYPIHTVIWSHFLIVLQLQP